MPGALISKGGRNYCCLCRKFFQEQTSQHDRGEADWGYVIHILFSMEQFTQHPAPYEPWQRCANFRTDDILLLYAYLWCMFTAASLKSLNLSSDTVEDRPD